MPRQPLGHDVCARLLPEVLPAGVNHPLVEIAVLVRLSYGGVSLPMFCLHQLLGTSLEEPVPSPLLICSVIYLNQCVPVDIDIIYGL